MAEHVARCRPASVATKGARRARAAALSLRKAHAPTASAAPEDVVTPPESDVAPSSTRRPCAAPIATVDPKARSREIEIEPDPLGGLLLRWACEAELALQRRDEASTDTREGTTLTDRDELLGRAASRIEGRIRIRDVRR